MHQSVSAIVIERQQQLDAVLHEISGLETVMDGIKNLHQQLVEKKDRITRSMNVHKGFISSLWRLPTEIVSQIFDHCLPDDSCLLSPTMSHAPVLLTKICRRWREFAVGTPRLWCRLYVYDTSDWQRAAVCYDSWLKRSRGCPLSLELDRYANDLTKLRRLFQPYVNQISSLSIHLYLYEEKKTEILLKDLPKDLPALSEVTIITNFERITPSTAQSISQLPSTLRSLKVTGSSFRVFDAEHLSSFDPVWARVADVEIAVHHPNAFLHLLKLCPNLTSLKVRVHRDPVEILEPFTHTEIRSLFISFSFVRPAFRLFDALSLPSLRVLEARYIRTWPHEQFKAFLARSKCPLERLTFGSLNMMVVEQHAEYVDLFPSLEVIVVDQKRTSFA
ncbi:uncharacterized protein EDB91DRAFT_52837 [Suillus paluster]|uniref:uncharacterized protein n=1 Tax=Suillus paluster TaxID=48578 RepID=UPI001B878ED0|nr:uncharacterized protein EDB91DRAFT_52837 [Suillus paluster]KAG1747983.1 hypothetical protein EDB91DRAFT_52837 [Suillus paluster]